MSPVALETSPSITDNSGTLVAGSGNAQFKTPLSLTSQAAMTACYATGGSDIVGIIGRLIRIGAAGHDGSGGDSSDDWTPLYGTFSQGLFD